MNRFAIDGRAKGRGLSSNNRSARLPSVCVAVLCLAALAPALLSTPAQGKDIKAETLEKAKKASVMVFTKSSRRTKGDTTHGSGSGFIVNGTGLVISNNHVVDPVHGKSPIEKHQFHYQTGKLVWEVVTEPGTEKEATREAVVVYQNEAADQALLQMLDENGKNLQTEQYLRFLPESRLRKRMKVWALGFPGGDSQSQGRDEKHPAVSVTTGNVIDIPRTPGGRVRMIYTDVVARPGNSGGPMVDQDGFLVGTVTLMMPPEGRELTGGANYSALVPTKLSAQMIRNSFDLGKIREGTDVTPFMDALTDEHGRIIVPEYKRLADRDQLFFDDGDRIYGAIPTKGVTWESALGKLEVPVNAVAYVMTNSEGAMLFLEGGNHIRASEVDATFQFKPEGGDVIEQRFADVGVVGFKQSDRNLKPVTGEVVVLDTDVCHLVLTNVEGNLKLKSRAGVITAALEDIERLDADVADTRVIIFNDGRRLTGTFDEASFRATIAATGTPIQFDLSRVEFATVEILQVDRSGVAGLGLLGVLAEANRELRLIARGLQSNDPSSAQAKLDEWVKPSSLKRLPEGEKEQVKLLEAVALVRAGKYEEATRAFRTCQRSKDENLAAYAQATVDVLKRFNGYKYDGRSLSDRATLIEAGAVLADELIAETRDFLKDARRLEGKTRGEYMKTVSRVKKLETTMAAAAVFGGAAADDQLIRLWKSATAACEREIIRIQTLKEEKQNESRGGRPSSGSRSRGGSALLSMSDREQRELDEQLAQAQETRQEFLMKLFDYGFRIEDPDIQEFQDNPDEYNPDKEP